MVPTFTRDIRQGLPILVVSGELDVYTRTQFADALQSLDASAERVLIDFCGCRYFDSSALTELIAFRRARSDTQDVMLAVPNPSLRRILEITRLDGAFHMANCIHETRIERAS